MQIFKNNFFWYVFGLTTFIVSIYFFIFSDRLNHHKFVQNRLSGDILLKTYYDYENLEKNLNIYKKLLPRTILKKNEFQYHIDNIFAKIIRFTQTNKNHKYDYRDYKKLNKKEFKELEKILNNISLEGAYFLSPKHLDKVTVNLFTSKSIQKEKFLDYYRFVIDREVDKYIGFQPTSGLRVFSTEESYKDLIAEANLIRHLNHGFLNYIYYEINKYPNTTEVASLNLSEIKYLLVDLKCPFFEIGDATNPFCKVIYEQDIEKIVKLYEKLLSIKTHTLKFLIPPHFIDSSFKNRSLFDKLITEWTEKSDYTGRSFYKIISKAFSKKGLSNIPIASILKKERRDLNNNFDFRFLNSTNYNTETLKEKLFLNLKEVETKKNYFELLSFIIFALIFSFTANIIYRSFLNKK